jgi:hypothetical protein
MYIISLLIAYLRPQYVKYVGYNIINNKIYFRHILLKRDGIVVVITVQVL